MRVFAVLIWIAWAMVGPGAFGEEPSETLLGSWMCEAGPCPDEEVFFGREEGESVYRSWLHARPSVMDGTWRLDGSNLVVECCQGVAWDWEVLEVGEEVLRLREEGGEEVTFRRIGAVEGE